jgi:hypothetical protein
VKHRRTAIKIMRAACNRADYMEYRKAMMHSGHAGRDGAGRQAAQWRTMKHNPDRAAQVIPLRIRRLNNFQQASMKVIFVVMVLSFALSGWLAQIKEQKRNSQKQTISLSVNMMTIKKRACQLAGETIQWWQGR